MKKKLLKNLKCITFDFWNTLYGDTKEDFKIADEIRMEYLIKTASKYNKHIDKKEAKELIKYDNKVFYTVWKEQHKTLLPEQRIKLILKKLNLEINEKDKNQLTEKFQNVIFKRPPKISSNIKKILSTLKKSNIKLGIISDTGYAVGDLLKELMSKDNILKYFDAFSFSDETGVAKPQEKAFKKIFDDLNVDKPEQMLHLGDLERTDIEGALKLGVKAGLYIGFYNINGYLFETTKANIYIEDWLELLDHIALN